MAASIITDFVCFGCECLCDGVRLTVERNRITSAENVCERGRRWLLQPRDNALLPACRVDGKSASLKEGLIEAAKILKQSRYPLVCGLNETTCQSQQLAAAIADRIGACIDHTTSAGDLAALLALQQAGVSTGTLGEVRDRCDFILYWGAEPSADSRHSERFTFGAPSRWFGGGQVHGAKTGRSFAAIDSQPNSVSPRAEFFLPIPPGRDYEAIQALRAMLQDLPLDAAQVELYTEQPLDRWRELLARMKAARYGAIFYGDRLTDAAHSAKLLESLFRFVRELNRHTRFVTLPLGKSGNGTGARHVLAWRTGFASGVSLAAGFPRFGPDEYTTAALLERKEIDAALIVSGDLLSQLDPSARRHLERIPFIALADRETETAQQAAVSFFTSTTGLHTSGTVFRSDGIPLPLRAAMISSHPSDTVILEQLLQIVAR